jgi:hydroxymethylbilane synthase
LARAGLERLEFYDSESTQIIIENKVLECLPLSVIDFIPAAGQGAIAIETLTDAPIVDSLKLINDVDTEDCVGVEREFLRLLGAGCDTPVGVSAHLLPGNELQIRAIVFDEEKLDSDPKTGTNIGERNELNKIAFDLLKQMGIDAFKHE